MRAGRRRGGENRNARLNESGGSNAALIIGDLALFLDHQAAGVQKIDLGQIWTESTGLPFVYDGWFGLMAPAGVPREIIAKINKDVVHMLQTPEAKAKLAAQFVLPVTDTPEAFDKIIRDETANLTQVFKEAGIGN